MTDEHATPVSEKLRRAREESGLSLRQVSERSGVSFAQIRRVEQGLRTATPDFLQKVAPVLSLDLESVLEPSSIILPEPRAYFRRKFGVSEQDAEVMARLIEKYQTKGGINDGENIEDSDAEAD